MNLNIADINWWAVLAAAVASFVIGGLWYTVLFGRAWQRIYKFTEADLKQMGAHPERTFPTLFLCDLAAAVVVAVLAINLGLTGALPGVGLGIMLWAGVLGAGMLATTIGSGRPFRGWLIDAGKHLASLVVIGAVVAGWR